MLSHYPNHQFPMLILPVLDLMGGVVVRGVAGNRGEYRPVESQLCADAQPRTVARAFVERLGLAEAYVADLDAIAGREPAWETYRDLAECGLALWVDAGAGEARRAERLADFAANGRPLARIVVGLESLAGHAALRSVVEATGVARAVFSLDLKQGRPLNEAADWRDAAAEDIAADAVAAGIREAIVLDLAQVGVRGGVSTLDLCRRLRARFSGLRLIGGGGVRGLDDLVALSAAGCDAALVATALHDGRLGRDEIARVAGRHEAGAT